MREILKKVHVNIPFQDLVSKYMDRFLERGINPEIGFNCFALDEESGVYSGIAEKIEKAGLKVTVHGPFMDLRPGAIDPQIRKVSADEIKKAAGIARLFKPLNIVGHPSFDRRYYPSSEDQWLGHSIETWSAVLEVAESCGATLCLENVYESGPRQIKALLDGLGSPRAGFCLDTGHFNVFAEAPLEEWIGELGGYIRELHLHDNFGKTDEHLPVGEGNFPFHDLFTMIKNNRKPVITLEPHNETHLWKTLENLEKSKLLEILD
jgi:sugar phosphate isomerase/epimerase